MKDRVVICLHLDELTILVDALRDELHLVPLNCNTQYRKDIRSLYERLRVIRNEILTS